MEQQTISIAKAGITTILNSRTAVLAAANPLLGKYDDLRAISDQIDLQTTILSRFDCIFVVRDKRDKTHDKQMAMHICNVHQGNIEMDTDKTDIPIPLMKKYIAYARSKVSPRLTEKAAHMLTNLYVKDRQTAKKDKLSR